MSGQPVSSGALALFDQWRRENPYSTSSEGAIWTLTQVIKQSEANTIMGLDGTVKEAAAALMSHYHDSLLISSGCTLFTRFVLRVSTDIPDYDLLRRKLIERGEAFRQIAGNAQDRVAEFAQDFLRPSGTYICCSYSSVVLRALVEAHNHNKHLHIFVLESRPECSGRLMAAELEAHTNHTVSLLYDTAASAVMERCDAVLLGAEALCESGGIINKLGSHTLAIVARSYHRPVLVLAQSFKFTRLFPLSQRDVPQPHALRSGKGNEWWTPYAPTSADISELNLDGLMLQPTKRVPATSRDYTPPEYLSLMITDLGVLSPAAISDELIKLYF